MKTASLTKQFVRDCRSGRRREWREVEKQKGQKQAPTQQLDTFIHTNTHLIPWAGCKASCHRGSSLTSITYFKYERIPSNLFCVGGNMAICKHEKPASNATGVC